MSHQLEVTQTELEETKIKSLQLASEWQEALEKKDIAIMEAQRDARDLRAIKDRQLVVIVELTRRLVIQQQVCDGHLDGAREKHERLQSKTDFLEAQYVEMRKHAHESAQTVHKLLTEQKACVETMSERHAEMMQMLC